MLEEDITVEYRKICFRHLFRPDELSWMVMHKIEGQGDCRVCTADKDNEKCPAFSPKMVMVYEKPYRQDS